MHRRDFKWNRSIQMDVSYFFALLHTFTHAHITSTKKDWITGCATRGIVYWTPRRGWCCSTRHDSGAQRGPQCIGKKKKTEKEKANEWKCASTRYIDRQTHVRSRHSAIGKCIFVWVDSEEYSGRLVMGTLKRWQAICLTPFFFYMRRERWVVEEGSLDIVNGVCWMPRSVQSDKNSVDPHVN